MLPTLTLPAPAKLNLFLHVTGRRADGYHQLQTLFQLLDWGDQLHFSANRTGLITLDDSGLDIPQQDNLFVRAARLLQQGTLGAHIRLEKQIPAGGGLGGGSSDAATTLLALNHLWSLDRGRSELQALGAELGADVPVFVGGIIPKEDVPALQQMGVATIFGPGSSLTEITAAVQETLARE